MYCGKCGNELQEGMIYCNKCGTKIEVENNQSVNNMNNQQYNTNTIQTNSNTSNYNNSNYESKINIYLKYIKQNKWEFFEKILLPIIIIGIIIGWTSRNFKNTELNFDKQQMLSTIQKYSYSTITVDDYSIKEVEKTNTLVIYKVSVTKSGYLITGDFYVGLVKTKGTQSADYVVLDQNLTKLKNTIENY